MAVQFERRDDGVAILTLGHPDRRNAMTEAMGDALAERSGAQRWLPMPT